MTMTIHSSPQSPIPTFQTTPRYPIPIANITATDESPGTLTPTAALTSPVVAAAAAEPPVEDAEPVPLAPAPEPVAVAVALVLFTD